VKESNKKIFQQIWAAAFIGTHPKANCTAGERHKNRGKGAATRA